MFKAVRDTDDRRETARSRRKQRRLRRVAMLPTLLTLGSLFFGFFAIYSCALEMKEYGAGREPAAKITLKHQFFEARAPSYLSIAFWMVAAAGICDALDGRVARKTGASSKFGEQLDSLADIVSFGVAPALMMVTLIHREGAPFDMARLGQATVLIGSVYVCCAGLRLARFTVEASPEEAAHVGFRGLPSPGAAAAVVSGVFLHEHLALTVRWAGAASVLATALPLLALVSALAMVSRLPYTHFVSALLRRRPFGHVIVVLLAVLLTWLYTEVVAAAMAWVFLLSGPIRRLTGNSENAGAGATDAEAGDPVASDASVDPVLKKQA